MLHTGLSCFDSDYKTSFVQVGSQIHSPDTDIGHVLQPRIFLLRRRCERASASDAQYFNSRSFVLERRRAGMFNAAAYSRACSMLPSLRTSDAAARLGSSFHGADARLGGRESSMPIIMEPT